MLSLKTSYPPRVRPVPAGPGPVVRCALCVLAFCLGLQGVALSAQRALGQAHYHLSAARSMNQAMTGHENGNAAHDEQGHRHSGRGIDEPAHGPDVGHDPEAAPERGQVHSHAGLAHHDHAAAVDDVVYVADDDHASSPGTVATATRSVHDLDGMMPRLESLADSGSLDHRPDTGPSQFRSHVTHPLERPPRA